jgi:hypothetical protein
MDDHPPLIYLNARPGNSNCFPLRSRLRRVSSFPLGIAARERQQLGSRPSRRFEPSRLGRLVKLGPFDFGQSDAQHVCPSFVDRFWSSPSHAVIVATESYRSRETRY